MICRYLIKSSISKSKQRRKLNRIEQCLNQCFSNGGHLPPEREIWDLKGRKIPWEGIGEKFEKVDPKKSVGSL